MQVEDTVACKRNTQNTSIRGVWLNGTLNVSLVHASSNEQTRNSKISANEELEINKI